GSARPAASGNPIAHHVAVIGAMCAFMIGLTLASGVSPVLSGKLPDTDDYMRMVQVFQWLDGASWQDLLEPRLNPPAGTPRHWARLPDLPLAAVVGSLEPWLGRGQAAMVAASLVPPLLFAAFLWCVAWMARPLTGRGAALLAVIVIALPMP